MDLSPEKFKDLLVTPKLVSLPDFETAVAESEAKHRPLWEVLIDRDLIRDGELAQVVAEHYDLRRLDLRREEINPRIFNLVPELVARKLQEAGAVGILRVRPSEGLIVESEY